MEDKALDSACSKHLLGCTYNCVKTHDHGAWNVVFDLLWSISSIFLAILYVMCNNIFTVETAHSWELFHNSSRFYEKLYQLYHFFRSNNVGLNASICILRVGPTNMFRYSVIMSIDYGTR